MNSILKDDDSGQFILLMSVVVAIGLVILLVFLNQSMLAGHSSAQSIMDFPKNDIRDLRSATLSEAQFMVNNVNNQINSSPSSYNNNTTAFDTLFNGSFNNYIQQVQSIFEAQGTFVNVTYQNTVIPFNLTYRNQSYNISYCNNTTINLYYNNGETSYNDITYFT